MIIFFCYWKCIFLSCGFEAFFKKVLNFKRQCNCTNKCDSKLMFLFSGEITHLNQ